MTIRTSSCTRSVRAQTTEPHAALLFEAAQAAAAALVPLR
jgi:hypothetical protein